MNSKYFQLPFALTIGGILGWIAAFALTIWLVHRLPVVKNLVRNS